MTQPQRRRNHLPPLSLSALSITLALALFHAAPARAQDAPAAPCTDEQVVASMQKAADFLLGVKKGDNWESGKDRGELTAKYHGGETALVLYALLHAGESLQDDPEYHSKLSWRSKELAPAVEWLSKNMPDATYAAGLEASALTLLPKRTDEKPGEGPKAALDACRWYLISAMGKWGGYVYTNFNIPKGYTSFEDMWWKYCKNPSHAIKVDLDGYIGALYNSYLGPQVFLQEFGATLKTRLNASKDPAEIARLQNEIQEIPAYMKTMPPPPALDKDVADAKHSHELMVEVQKKGVFPAPDPEAKGKMLTKEECDTRLLGSQRWLDAAEGKLRGFYPIGDLSNGQYGTLGAWALMDYGMELPNAYWIVQDHFWRNMQQPDGSWAYDVHDTAKTKDTMGVAGIASLFVAQEFVDTELRLTPKPDKNIDAGLAWLNKSYKPGSDNLYYMYGVERVGLASGLKFFGTTNWYLEGAAHLIKTQKPDGSWALWSDPDLDASYALLFLARGRNPVVFNKLQYHGPWNARPHDDAYITRWMSKRFEKPINWQVVNLQVSPEEWQDAPILLITGSVDPKFSAADLAKIKAFITAGGMVFSTADGNSMGFTNAMKKYAAEVVDKKYEMRILPKNHELFSKAMGVELPNPPPLLGMSNGIREIWIHSTNDVGADWQMRKFASKNFELGAALYFYASGMGSLRSKLQPLAVAASTDQPSRTLEVARIDYPGNSDPEPGRWPRLAKLARANYKTQINLSLVKCADLDPAKYPLAHLTGTTKVTFTDEEVAKLKDYVNGGGLLFIDCAGGNPEFAASAEDLIKQIYPKEKLAPLGIDNPIYTGDLPDGTKLANVEFRKFGNLQLHRRLTTPELSAVTTNARLRILYSPWDISSGFLGTNTWGIIGYTPATSEALARNILLYTQNPPAAAPAAN